MSMNKSGGLVAAYAALGLPNGATEDEVKLAYKRLAMRHHPDKNIGNPDATAKFQDVSHAYDVLTRHFRKPEQPSRPRFHPFGFEDNDDDSEYYDSEDDYDSDSEEEFAFFMYMFEQAMRDRFSNMGRRGFRRDYQERAENPQEYANRLRRQQHEARVRRERAEYEREQERKAAASRQKAKALQKKARAEVDRQAAESAAQKHAKNVQTKRSAVFAAARSGNAADVKKGIWENDVDASGGEIKIQQFVQVEPNDPQETLLHIATRNGDVDLVKWLDSHSADPEERNSAGLTAFQVALHRGDIPIVSYFLEAYPPKEEESKNVYSTAQVKSGPESKTLLRLAVESREPEVVYFVLENGLTETEDMKHCFVWANSTEGQKHMKPRGISVEAREKVDDISELLMNYGRFTPPPTTEREAESEKQKGSTPPPMTDSSPLNGQSPPGQKNARTNTSGKGNNKGRGKARKGRR
ncbi:DnaJ-domain-containing protein [Flagelloscypha sp. PMI_526]|nr:DnaJ-domain-containing protein [Flagelloscypha sp. PMI_526]